MIHKKYIEQVRLILRIIPHINKVPDFALHGGTAINLFYHDLPRLSVDIDLTYISLKSRSEDLRRIKSSLEFIAQECKRLIPGISVSLPTFVNNDYKLICKLNNAQVKVEVNTILRGCIGSCHNKSLSSVAQELFDEFVSVQVVPEPQLFGGKIVAALDRQHPRDLFDTKIILDKNSFSDKLTEGFLFCLLNSNRPLHEVLSPNFTDQSVALKNQFWGMTREPFTYDMFLNERIRLNKAVATTIKEHHKEFLLSFAKCSPKWLYGDWSSFPGIAWKIHNQKVLQKTNQKKFFGQIDQLEKLLLS